MPWSSNRISPNHPTVPNAQSEAVVTAPAGSVNVDRADAQRTQPTAGQRKRPHDARRTKSTASVTEITASVENATSCGQSGLYTGRLRSMLKVNSTVEPMTRTPRRSPRR